MWKEIIVRLLAPKTLHTKKEILVAKQNTRRFLDLVLKVPAFSKIRTGFLLIRAVTRNVLTDWAKQNYRFALSCVL